MAIYDFEHKHTSKPNSLEQTAWRLQGEQEEEFCVGKDMRGIRDKW